MSQSRRQFFLTLSSFLLCGCGESVRNTFKYIYNGAADVPVTRQQVAQLPYASIFAKAGMAPRSLLILGRVDGQDLHWISADRGAIVTRQGRVVKTVGFEKNLIDTRDFSDFSLSTVVQAKHYTTQKNIDISPGFHFDIAVNSEFTVLGKDKIEILDLFFETNVIKESFYAKALDWRFENYYWVDTTSGTVWKSIQHTAPNIPPIEVQILKPVG